MSIYRTAVKNPVTTALIFIAFMIFGLFSLSKTSIAMFPDFDANTIMVMSSYQGASAADIETNLTKLLENSLNGVANLKSLTSNSKENISILTLQFEYGTDIDEATNDVRDKLDLVNSALPDGASVPAIFKFSADDMPILILSARAGESLPGLDKILDDKVATPLARVTGVGTVSINGAPTREIQVYCDPNKLQAYGLSISTIAQIIGVENRNLPSGSIDIGSETYNLRVQKEFRDPSEMLDIVLGSFAGRTIYLRDVATVRDGSQEREQEAYTNGTRAATVVIQKQSGANTVSVIKKVKRQLEVIKKTLPSDIEITPVIDSSENIINTINTLKETIIITLLVVMFVVFIFLGRWRATFIIVLSIPVALLASLVYLFATGNTLNIISMSALSIAIGMVVDDAIVVLENVSTHLERGEKPNEAAVHATSEVAISVIASTLTMLCVFLPLTMLSGMAGIMFKQLGYIVSIIMIVSTTAALTLVPMLCAQFLKVGRKTGKLHNAVFGVINATLDWISEGYAKIIAWATTHRKSVIFGSFGILVVVMALYLPGMKTEFFPQSDQGRLSLTVELPVGTSQEVTGEFAKLLHKEIRDAIPEIKISSFSFGQADSDNAFASMQNNGSNVISMNINAGSMENRDVTTDEMSKIIRGICDRHPEIKKAQVREGMGGMGGASSLEIEIYGYDFESTDKVAKALQAEMLKTTLFRQVTLSRDEYTPEYQVDFDRTKLALNGLNSTTAGAAFSAAMSGSIASFYREDGEEYNIRVRYAPQFRTSIEDIENIIIYTPQGKAVRMGELGQVVETQVPPSIERKDRSRIITVTGVLPKGVALSEAVEGVNAMIDGIDVPPELSVVVAGDYEDQQEMMSDMMLLMALIILLVYMVMAAQFESWSDPFIIMLISIPFTFSGLVLALWMTGVDLNIMSMLGGIMLIGIVVKNGIVLIDYTILLRERGYSLLRAASSAARSRLRPILMTTLTTILGMTPMALSHGVGSEMWRPMGIAIIGGLLISTIMTLIYVPSMFCVFGGIGIKNRRRTMRKQRQLDAYWREHSAEEKLISKKK